MTFDHIEVLVLFHIHHLVTANDETPSVNPTTGEPTEEQEDPSEVSDSSFKADCTVKAVTPSTSPVKGNFDSKITD